MHTHMINITYIYLNIHFKLRYKYFNTDFYISRKCQSSVLRATNALITYRTKRYTIPTYYYFY